MKQFSKFLIGLIVTVIFASGLALLSSTSAYADAPPSGSVIVHRGIGPENYVGSLGKSIHMGADGFETDVRFTSDGVGVLNHDSTWNRTTNGTGRVTSHTYRYASRLRIGHSHAHPSTYHQGLVLCRDSQAKVCMFEAKKGATMAQVRGMAADAVSIMGDQLWKFTIEADTFRQVRTIKREFPQVSVAYVVFDRWQNVSTIKASGADGIIANRPTLSRARVASATQAGLWVTPYSIETRAQLARVRHMGADGAMTDSSRLVG